MTPKVAFTLSRSQIISQIKRLFSKRQPLNISAVKRTHPELIKAVYAQPRFWGWRGALKDSAIDYSRINVELIEYVTCKICGIEMKALGGLHLEYRHEIQPSDYVAEFPDAEMRSEIQHTYKPKAKLIMPHWEPLATPEYILDRVAYFHGCGIEVNQRNILLNEPSLMRHSMVFHKSWDDILTRIGLDPKDIRHSVPDGTYSEEHIVSQLKQLHSNGHDMSYANLKLVEGTSTLYARAIREFGSYNKALEAAGIDPALYSPYALFEKKYQRFDQEMKATIKRPPLERDKAFIGIRKEFSNVIAARYKGSWARVLEAYKVKQN